MYACPSKLNEYSPYSLAHLLVPLTVELVLCQHAKSKLVALLAGVVIIYTWETLKTLLTCGFGLRQPSREGAYGEETRWNSLVVDIFVGAPAVVNAFLLVKLFGSPVRARPWFGRLWAGLVFFGAGGPQPLPVRIRRLLARPGGACAVRSVSGLEPAWFFAAGLRGCGHRRGGDAVGVATCTGSRREQPFYGRSRDGVRSRY